MCVCVCVYQNNVRQYKQQRYYTHTFPYNCNIIFWFSPERVNVREQNGFLYKIRSKYY